MIELIAARGNTSLESAVSLTKMIRWEIQNLGQSIGEAATAEQGLRKGKANAKSRIEVDLMLKNVISNIKKLLSRIEDAVPLINLAITTSGVNLSSSLPSTVSPSRLLQASTFLTAGDNQYATLGAKTVQIGPTFTLSLYMLFAGHIRARTEEDIRASTWKEVIHKARLKLMRVPLNEIEKLPDPAASANFAASIGGHNGTQHFPGARVDEFAYQLVIIEDLDDDRVHTYEEDEAQPEPYDDIGLAGIREAIPVHEISKIFYADTGKILNIGGDGETNSPILLLKRDLNAVPPRRMLELSDTMQAGEYDEDDEPDEEPSNETASITNVGFVQSEIDAQLFRESRPTSEVPQSPSPRVKQDHETWRIPKGLDPEWLAFEVYTEEPESEAESDEADTTSSTPAVRRDVSALTPLVDQNFLSAVKDLDINRSPPTNQLSAQQHTLPASRAAPKVVTSLSLLETLLRLLSLQQFQQTSHLAIPDELLNFFLSEAATTGAATGDEAARRRMRNDARHRVGFDPYDESPIKRRGEEYQYRGGTSQRGDVPDWTNEADWDGQQGYAGYEESSEAEFDRRTYDEGYDTRSFSRSSPARPQSRPVRLDSSPKPPFLLRNDSATNARDTNNGPRTPSPRVRGATDRVRSQGRDSERNVRQGSPLARPATAMTDEGVVVSPEDGSK
jgi:hypothetical protein